MMKPLSINLTDTLTAIRQRAVEIAGSGWPELGNFIEASLPNPLDPMVLIPVATGVACGGALPPLTHVAAVILLFGVAYHAVDDCIDQDNPNALHHSFGVGPAMNYAMALSTVAGRELYRSPIPAHNLNNLLNTYFQSALQVCQGQDYDFSQQIDTLADYEALVNLKTIPAYQFAAAVGASLVAIDRHAVKVCATCGVHLGWMIQILDDIEAFWFPVVENQREIEKMTFAILTGLAMDHPQVEQLRELCQTKPYNRLELCNLLDEMNVRSYLIHQALDHRDQAVAILKNHRFNQEGAAILELCLDWYLAGGKTLLDDAL